MSRTRTRPSSGLPGLLRVRPPQQRARCSQMQRVWVAVPSSRVSRRAPRNAMMDSAVHV